MIQLTERATEKVSEILTSQEPKPSGLRISVVGGGCSGFTYSMAFENTPGMLDKTYDFSGLKVFVDQASMLYLDGIEVDYVESLEGKLRLFFLPPYSPELNPDELVWNDVKNNAVGRMRLEEPRGSASCRRRSAALPAEESGPCAQLLPGAGNPLRSLKHEATNVLLSM